MAVKVYVCPRACVSKINDAIQTKLLLKMNTLTLLTATKLTFKF